MVEFSTFNVILPFLNSTNGLIATTSTDCRSTPDFSMIKFSNPIEIIENQKFFLLENLIIENHLKQCEFCSDALKGVNEMNDAIHIYSITSELRKRMSSRLKPKHRIFSRFDIFSILLVLFILGLILFLAFYFLMVKW